MSPGLPFSGAEAFYSGHRSPLLNSSLQNFFLRDQSFKVQQAETPFPKILYEQIVCERPVLKLT